MHPNTSPNLTDPCCVQSLIWRRYYFARYHTFPGIFNLNYFGTKSMFANDFYIFSLPCCSELLVLTLCLLFVSMFRTIFLKINKLGYSSVESYEKMNIFRISASFIFSSFGDIFNPWSKVFVSDRSTISVLGKKPRFNFFAIILW